MKEDLKLINIGNGKFILCLNNNVTCELLRLVERKLAECQITNVCLIPVTIKEVGYDIDK